MAILCPAWECIQVVELKPDWPKGYSRVGAAAYGAGDYDAAIEAYEKGTHIDLEFLARHAMGTLFDNVLTCGGFPLTCIDILEFKVLHRPSCCSSAFSNRHNQLSDSLASFSRILHCCVLCVF